MHRLNDLINIGEAAKLRGVSIDTLRRWEKTGKIKTERTEIDNKESMPPKAKKPKNKYAQVQRQRLMLYLGVFVDVVFLGKLKNAIEVQTTIIHPVTSCSDREQVDGIIAALESVRKDTKNLVAW